MPIININDFDIVSPSPDNFILKLSVKANYDDQAKTLNFIGSGEHVYQEENESNIDKTLITDKLAHSSIFKFDEEDLPSLTAYAMFDMNDVGMTTDTDDNDSVDNLLLLPNANLDPSAKIDFPLHVINSNAVYGYVAPIKTKSFGFSTYDKRYGGYGVMEMGDDPMTRYHHRPMATSISSVLGLGDQTNYQDTFDKIFVFDPTDSNRLSFSNNLRNWRSFQSNRNKSSNRVTNDFDFGKLLVRAILFPKSTLNNEYSTERQYLEDNNQPYKYMRKYSWDDDHFYSNGEFIVFNSREDNDLNGIIGESGRPGTMVTSKYSNHFGDVVTERNEVTPPSGRMDVNVVYNKVEDITSSKESDRKDNESIFKQYMPELINRENETASDSGLMTSKHKVNIFDVDIISFWNKLSQSMGSVKNEVRSNMKDMIKKNLYDMIEDIKPAHTKLYRVLITDGNDGSNN